MAEGDQSVTPNMEVLLSLAEIRGQLTSLLGLMSGQGERITKLENEHSLTRDRVTVLEATKRATPTFWTVVAGIAALGSIIAVVLLFLDRLYGK